MFLHDAKRQQQKKEKKKKKRLKEEEGIRINNYFNFDVLKIKKKLGRG